MPRIAVVVTFDFAWFGALWWFGSRFVPAPMPRRDRPVMVLIGAVTAVLGTTVTWALGGDVWPGSSTFIAAMAAMVASWIHPIPSRKWKERSATSAAAPSSK
ncbi:MAG: hypothetical protein JWN67_4466 [Actinomycetia bacterium]|nr:hypothetical protein [Actinomycetes bacterium]